MATNNSIAARLERLEKRLLDDEREKEKKRDERNRKRKQSEERSAQIRQKVAKLVDEKAKELCPAGYEVLDTHAYTNIVMLLKKWGNDYYLKICKGYDIYLYNSYPGQINKMTAADLKLCDHRLLVFGRKKQPGEISITEPCPHCEGRGWLNLNDVFLFPEQAKDLIAG